MACDICSKPLFPTSMETGANELIIRANDNHIGALSCGDIFHLECLRSWERHVNIKTCPRCNVRHTGSIRALHITCDKEHCDNSQKYSQIDTSASTIDVELSIESSTDVTILSAAGLREPMDIATSLQITTGDKGDLVKRQQTIIDELTKKVAHLQSRESELLTLSKRHKTRARKLQNAFDILKQNIAKADNDIRENDAVQL